MGTSEPRTESNSSDFLNSLTDFSKQHRAQRWEGSLGDYLTKVLPASPAAQVRTSHEYIWDMLLWYGRDTAGTDVQKARELFKRELFGVDEPLGRVVDYFKAAAAGSDVGRRLLLLLGPPSGGKSTLAILLKRGLEEYSRTDEGALYAIKGSPLRESPLNLIPASLRADFREIYGVDVTGEMSPWARDYVDRQCEGDYLRVPVERIFLSEASRCGIGTYAPHDPSTADIADLVGSVDLSKVSEVGDEGDPRAWSWSGAVYAASRGVLEMIEILKVKREFLYLLLTMTQEKNVKVARFPADLSGRDHSRPYQSRRIQPLPPGEGERGPARPDGHHQGAVRPVVPGRGPDLQEAGVRRPGIPQHPPGSSRAEFGGGVRDSDAA